MRTACSVTGRRGGGYWLGWPRSPPFPSGLRVGLQQGPALNDPRSLQTGLIATMGGRWGSGGALPVRHRPVFSFRWRYQIGAPHLAHTQWAVLRGAMRHKRGAAQRGGPGTFRGVRHFRPRLGVFSFFSPRTSLPVPSLPPADGRSPRPRAALGPAQRTI